MLLLDKQSINDYLAAYQLERFNVHVFNELPSTNDWLKANGQKGDICIAEKQTAGRGRGGRTWHSPDVGNIYLSMKWCFDSVPRRYSQMAMYIALGICEVLKQHGVTEHGVKWPNDILWHQKKLSGILIESTNQLQDMTIGVGMNVHMPQTEQANIDQPYCSLQDIMLANHKVNQPIDRNALCADLIYAINNSMQQLLAESDDEFKQRWQQWSLLDKRRIEITIANPVNSPKDTVMPETTSIIGQVMGIDDHGRLLVKDEQTRKTITYSVGEIRILGYLD